MKKKKVFLILTLILVLILSGYILPITIANNFTKVTLINPYITTVTQDIYISGEVKELDVSQVITNIPLVPNNVLVKVGDTVTINQTLATIDKYATQDAIMSLANSVVQASSYTNIGNYLDVFEKYGIDLTSPIDDINDNVLAVSTSALPTSIKANTDGVITSIDLVKGNINMPQEIVCTISKTDQLYVQIDINEANITQINVGDSVLFKAVATNDEIFQGNITTIFPTATKVYQGTTQKTVIGAYVELTDSYSNLKPGYNITGVVKDNTTSTALVLPYETIQQDENNDEYVYIYENNRAVKQIITTGRELPQGVEILSGVTTNSNVIANSSQVKTHGSIVVG